MEKRKTQLGATNKRILIGLFVLGMLIFALIMNVFNELELANQRNEAHVYGKSVSASVQAAMESSINKSYLLAKYYEMYENDILERFPELCEPILNTDPTIGSMYIAPDAVIQAAYPEEVNASTIGFEMLKDPEQSADAYKAISTRQVTVSGPHNLVEGGNGFIVRSPIYVNDEFAAFAIIVLDWDKFSQKVLEQADTSTKYHFAIWKTDSSYSEADEDGYIIRNSDEKIARDMDIKIPVPNDEWHLTVVPADGYHTFRNLIPEMIFVAGFLLLIWIVAYIFLRNSEKLNYRLKYDEVTGVLAKQAFLVRAEQLMQKLPKENFDICVCDIKNFRLIRSAYGEEKANELLQYVAKVLQENTVRGICGSLDGEKFVGFAVADEERKKDWLVLVHDKIVNGSPIPNLVLKFGVYQNVDRELSVSMMCDRALLALKSIRNDYYHMYANYDGPVSMRHMKAESYENLFGTALKNGEFVIWYQPKHDAHTGEIVGAEALVRWKFQNDHMISPAEFIPLFEEDGLIIHLDEYVFRKVCEIQRIWKEKGKPLLPISVNLSRASLHNKGVVDHYHDIAKEIGIPPECVPLELTESAAANTKYVKEMTEGLKNAGFELNMDDFGSGFSSLESLNVLPFDIIKLDKSLVDYVGDPGGNEIIRHTIQIAHFKNMKVVAEGVETELQLKALREMECDCIQGYYYSPPKPYEQFAEYVRMNREKIENLHR